MAQFYKVLKADPLGEPWTPSAPNAKAIQNYWCQFEGEELDVSMGKQVGNSPKLGDWVYGDLVKATSQRGTQYWKFKSVQVPEGVQKPASTPAQAVAQEAVGTRPVDMSAQQPDWFVPWGNILIQLQKDMRLLKGDDDIPEPAEVPAPKLEITGNAPLDEKTQAMLEGVFTPDAVADTSIDDEPVTEAPKTPEDAEEK